MQYISLTTHAAVHFLEQYRLRQLMHTVRCKTCTGAWYGGICIERGVSTPLVSQGAFGYFPTYTLGAIAAVQLFQAASRELPTLEDDIAAGKFAPLRTWLNAHVHVLGSLPASGDELLQRATGPVLDPSLYTTHLQHKYKQIYGL